MRDCVSDSKDGLRFLKKHEETYGLSGAPDLAEHRGTPIGCVS